MSKKGYKKMTEAEFKKIKMLQLAGLSISDVRRIFNRSHQPISIAFGCETFQDYRDYRKEMNNKRYTQPEDGPKPIDMEDFQQIPSHVIASPDSQLERIAIALEALVEAWNSKPKGIFR